MKAANHCSLWSCLSFSRLKMAQLHSQSIVPCIQELKSIMECAGEPSMDTK